MQKLDMLVVVMKTKMILVTDTGCDNSDDGNVMLVGDEEKKLIAWAV